MKITTLSLLFTLVIPAAAFQVPVAPNIFLAVGVNNVEARKSIIAELKANDGIGSLRGFSFRAASVDSKTGNVTYSFSKQTLSNEEQTCYSDLKFTVEKAHVNPRAMNGKTVSQIEANYNCYREDRD